MKFWLFAIFAVLFSVYLQWPHANLDSVEALSSNYTRGNTLEGVVVVITGATSGIGKNLASTLHKLGATIVALGRSPTKLSHLQKELRDRIMTVQVDLDDLASVGNASEEIISKFSRIDFLVNNAGICYQPEDKLPTYKSVQGYDLLFAVNYLSHFLLTEKLLPLLENSNYNPRIIQISSSFHWQIDTSELVTNNPIASHNEENTYLFRAYANSKLAQILHARALSKKLKRVKAYSICPGWVSTNILQGKNQWFLDAFAYSADGVGLSSTLNAMFRDNVPGDFVTNFHMKLVSYLLPTSPWATQWYVRDAIMNILAVFILAFQKAMFDPYAVPKSSPDSYNVTAQEELYKWSLTATSKWL